MRTDHLQHYMETKTRSRSAWTDRLETKLRKGICEQWFFAKSYWETRPNKEEKDLQKEAESTLVNAQMLTLHSNATVYGIYSLCRMTECGRWDYNVKKVSNFPFPSWDVKNQTLTGREYFNYSQQGRVWLVTSRLRTEKSLTFFTV